MSEYTGVNDYSGVVAAGIQWMDANAEKDWFLKIDLQTFKMENPCRCVLGQVMGDYWAAVEDYTLWNGEAIDLGFNLPDFFTSDAAETAAWDELERTWAGVIGALQQDYRDKRAAAKEA